MDTPPWISGWWLLAVVDLPYQTSYRRNRLSIERFRPAKAEFFACSFL